MSGPCPIRGGTSADSAHRRHGLHRRPAPPTLRGARGARALPLAPPGGPRPSQRHDDDRRRRRPRLRVVASGDARGRDGLLPGPLDGVGGSFAERSRAAAGVRGRGARRGRAPDRLPRWARRRDDLSEHLASRQEVGRILRESGVPTIEFRASIVIGSGSASFEMLRALVERLPVMVTPRWVGTRTQPIAIEDVLAYLARGARLRARRRRGVRDRRRGRLLLPRPDARVRRQRGLRRLDGPGAGADAPPVEPLARARHPRARRRRA